MAFTETAAKTLHAVTASTTAETFELTDAVRQVRVTNRKTTDTIFVRLVTGATSATSAEMEAAVVTAVASADETFAVLPGTSKVILKSPRSVKVAGSIIGNTSDYSIEGTVWFD